MANGDWERILAEMKTIQKHFTSLKREPTDVEFHVAIARATGRSTAGSVTLRPKACSNPAASRRSSLAA